MVSDFWYPLECIIRNESESIINSNLASFLFDAYSFYATNINIQLNFLQITSCKTKLELACYVVFEQTNKLRNSVCFVVANHTP